MSYDATDRRHIRLAEKSAKRADREREFFIAHIMSTPTGRAWMLELLEASHIFASTFSGNALNSAFSEGERNIGLRLINSIMTACPDEYVTMMRERNVKEITEDGRRSTNANPSRITYTDSSGNPFVDPNDT